ncbi:ATP-binding protein [Microvirga puerhi]|uniref:histidine kinase n=1 Tax=Microvirga puerhi TaxID=2876078 RepID=A0ABS7VKW4_9HYPH|nr:ATP-binding protein [Microvirga puerhi]MBZ6076172.1 PAS domain S-box protein [Microvirga puerhi]
MTDAPNRYETMLARLAADPASRLFAKPETGVLVWDTSVEHLLWTSPAAVGLCSVLADNDGRVFPDLRARDRLRALANGGAPLDGTRLERLWLDPRHLSPPVTFACRLARMEDGQTVLITAIVGVVPRLSGRPRSATPASVLERSVSGTDARSEDPPASAKTRGPIRFIWQADPEVRFLQVSSGLAEAVGPQASNIIGRTWDQVTRSAAEDPDGVVARLFAQRETWSGQTVVWTMDGSDRRVPIDWAGMPVFDAQRELVGFRGFGLVRMDAIREPAIPDDVKAEAGSGAAEEGTFDESAQGHVIGDDPQGRDETLIEGPGETLPETLDGRPDNAEPRDDGGLSPEASPSGARALPDASGLSNAERNAFREIARALGARLEPDPSATALARPDVAEPTPEPDRAEEPLPAISPVPSDGERVLDRLPVGVLVHRGEEILFVNRYLLDLAGYGTLSELVTEGGFVHLFRTSPALHEAAADGSPLSLTSRQGESIPIDVRLAHAEWDGAPADLMAIRPIPQTDASQRLPLVEAEMRQRESRVHELESILDTATDGVIVLDETGRIISLNRSAEALFGYDQREVVDDAITVLLAPESHIVALDYLEGLRSPGVQSLLNDGREVQGRVRQGGTIPLFMTMGRVHDGPGRKFCAVLRDITAFKKAEGELVGAKRAAEEASAQKSDLLAKISHEIRTPLNAILGFAEVMLEERFGSISNDRYKEYLKDIHASGAHVISLVNDLLDLAKVEAGRMELAFTSVSLNDLVLACVTLLQPQAARERIVMRTSFPAKLPPVVADERSMRQIVLNLVSNAIKFTDAGGQVIVSTALTDRGEIAFRVRDTGIGMTEKEVQAALEPFRQLATSRRRGGTGLGLPLTKALVEANRGALQISSSPNEGTLVEVIFPPTRVLAE